MAWSRRQGQRDPGVGARAGGALGHGGLVACHQVGGDDSRQNLRSPIGLGVDRPVHALEADPAVEHLHDGAGVRRLPHEGRELRVERFDAVVPDALEQRPGGCGVSGLARRAVGDQIHEVVDGQAVPDVGLAARRRNAEPTARHEGEATAGGPVVVHLQAENGRIGAVV